MILIKKLGPEASVIKIDGDGDFYLSLPDNRLINLQENWKENLSKKNLEKFFEIFSGTLYEQSALYIAKRGDLKCLLVYKEEVLQRLEEVHDGDFIVLSSTGEAQVVRFKIHKIGEVEGNEITPLDIRPIVNSE